ncbi:MAG: methyl-accepting chemotaxis protein [Pseudomonadota bacterium]
MQSWGISRRIGALGWINIGVLGAVASVALLATWQLARSFEGFKDTAAQTVLIGDITEHLYEMRMGALKYRVTSNEASIAEVEAKIAEIFEMEEQLLQAVDNEDLRTAFDKMNRDVGSYQTAFRAMSTFQKQREENVTTFESLTAAPVEGLQRLMEMGLEDVDPITLFHAGQAQASILYAQTYFERFLLTNLPEDYASFDDALATASGALSTVMARSVDPERIDVARTAKSDMEAMRAQVQVVQETITALSAERFRMDQVGPKLQKDAEEVLEAIVANQDVMADHGRTLITWTMLTLAVGSALAIFCAFVFSRRIGRDISNSIEEQVSGMSQLADGDLEVDIAGAEESHELGRMARAMIVFRDNAREARRLEAEKKEADLQMQRREKEDVARREAEEQERREEAKQQRQAMMRDLSESVGRVVDAASRGDFSTRVSANFDDAELVSLAEGLNTLMGNVESGLQETADIMEHLAGGDLTHRMRGEFLGLFGELQTNVNATLEQLTSILSDISSKSDGVWNEAATMTQDSEALARSTEKQAASLEESSAAMEEFSTSAKLNADNARSVSDGASSASARAEAAGEVVDAAVTAMSDIKDASARIGEIVEVMEGLAFQTNLLAVNASVEAARAGEAGKGFAVVATEVRALAQRSADASQDIKQLVEESAKQVAKGVGLVEQTGETLKLTVDEVRSMLQPLNELSESSKEQAIGVQEVTTALSQLDVITQDNASLSHQSRTTAEQMQEAARVMRELVGTFRTTPQSSSTMESAPEDLTTAA